MTRTEADLRDAVSGHPADPEAETRLSAFASGLDNAKPRQLRTWLVPIAAAVAVLIPVTTVLAIRSGQQHSPTASAIAPTTLTTDPSALFVTPWALTDYIPATGPAQHQSAATRATIVRFSQGHSSYSGFCNVSEGLAKVGHGTLKVTPTYTSAVGCPQSLQQGLSNLDGVNATWQIRGNRLTITVPDGSRLLLTATTAGPTAGGSSAATTVSATITGRFLQVGGPPLPSGGTRQAGISGPISAYTTSAGTGTPVATTHSDSTGTFILRLQPGTYYLYGTDPNSRQEPGNVPSRIAAANPVVTHTGATTTVDITAYVP